MANQIIVAIEERRTTVLFDPSRTIDDAQINELIRLATRAPTAFNLQNWRFIAVRTPEAKARLRKVAWDQVKITDAAVTFIVCGQLADHRVMADRLAPSVEIGLMLATMVSAWEAGAFISNSRSAAATRRCERQRSAPERSSTPPTRWVWAAGR